MMQQQGVRLNPFSEQGPLASGSSCRYRQLSGLACACTGTLVLSGLLAAGLHARMPTHHSGGDGGQRKVRAVQPAHCGGWGGGWGGPAQEQQSPARLYSCSSRNQGKMASGQPYVRPPPPAPHHPHTAQCCSLLQLPFKQSPARTHPGRWRSPGLRGAAGSGRRAPPPSCWRCPPPRPATTRSCAGRVESS